MSFIQELKRRNVIRMAGLYLVGAWLVTQVTGTVLPMFGAPEWVARSVVVLLAIGLLPALVFSWIFELTPDGLKRDGEVGAAQSIAPQTARRMDRMIIVVMALALGYFAVDKFVLAPGRIATQPDAATAAPGSDASSAMTASPEATTTADPATGKPIVRGIAVLPFDNLSPDPDNAFFAGGVYEEVLTKLSRIGELRVISRTSMERIAKDDLEVSAIGQRLGVTHVLEGSVRRAGDQVRITVQLIEAATDAHLWAENYDRQLDDVFAIQSEIALAIADQLKLTLSPELQANLSERPTQNQAAYALYLRALEQRGTWRGAEGFMAIIELLEPAVAADPDFLQAQILLANAHGRMNWTGSDADGSHADKARQAVADIVKRWPDRPESKLAQGQLLYNLDRDYAQALVHFEAARERLPNDIEVLRGIAGSLKRLGRFDEWLAIAPRLVELDPESSLNSAELIFALLANNRLDEAMRVAEAARSRFPDDPGTRGRWLRASIARDQDITPLLDIDRNTNVADDWVNIAHFVRGDVEFLTAPLPNADAPEAALYPLILRIELLRLSGRDDKAEPLIDQARTLVKDWSPASSDPDQNLLAALIWALAGEPGRAREHLAQARRELSATPRELLTQARIDMVLAQVERHLGDPEAGWLLLQPWADQPHILGHGLLLAFQPYYDQMYGESPSYRAYMAKIAGEKK